MTWTELRPFRAGLVLLAVAAGATHAATVPDEAREARWAAEVVPQVVVGDAVWLTTPHHARVLALYAVPSGESRGAVIVVHGAGVHPDWALVGEIRGGLVDRGYTTLSVQMPVLAADAPREAYGALTTDAVERLDAALDWLHRQGHARVAVLSHSMGASMVNDWMQAKPNVVAWVPVGMLVPFGSAPRMPVLDVIGEHDFPEARANLPRPGALRQDGCSATVTIAGADHFMTGAVPRLLDLAAPFLGRVFAGACRTARSGP